MDVAAWCGRCGDSFRLLEVVDDGNAGRCPRCGEPFAPGYAPVVAAAVRQLSAAARTIASAGNQLAELAPKLHIDAGKLAADLTEVLDRR